VIGVDVSAGTGISNSCLTVGDKKTGEQVAIFVDPYIRPEQLADYACALGRFFAGVTSKEAYMIWEGQGPGSDFGARLRELGYSSLHFHVQENTINKKVSKKPGWFSTGDGKRNLLTEFGRAMTAGELILRDKLTIQECSHYVWDAGGIIHAKTKSAMDPSGAKNNHGDRAMAAAIMWKGLRAGIGARKKEEEIVLPGSFEFRRNEWKRGRAEGQEGWGADVESYAIRISA
jgi:hypothetical protein